MRTRHMEMRPVMRSNKIELFIPQVRDLFLSNGFFQGSHCSHIFGDSSQLAI